MGPPGKQHRILEGIENSLRRSDPRLTELFAAFSRLTMHEEMPGTEEVRHRIAVPLLPVWRRLPAVASWLRIRPAARTKAALLFPLAFALVAASVTVSPKAAGSSRCGRRPAATRLARSSAPTRSCGPGAMNPLFFGK